MSLKEHNTTISIEDIQFNAYKASFQKGEKFLRSKWRNLIIKHTENEKISELNFENLVEFEEKIKPENFACKKKSSTLPMSKNELIISKKKILSPGNKISSYQSKAKQKEVRKEAEEPMDDVKIEIEFEGISDINPNDMMIQCDSPKSQLENVKFKSENPKNSLIKIRNDPNTFQQIKFTIFPIKKNTSEYKDINEIFYQNPLHKLRVMKK